MAQNSDPGAEQVRVEGGTPANAPQSQSQPQQGYVPPELRPTGASYTGTDMGQGEPTRRWDNQSQSQPQSQPQPQPAPPMQPQPQTYFGPRQPHRAPIFGPILLIGAGLVFLLINLGVFDENVWAQIFQLWPLLLIAIGLDLLIGRRNPALSILVVLLVIAAGAAFVYAGGGLKPLGNAVDSQLNVPLNGAKSATVRISTGIATLNIDALGTEATQLATGSLGYYQNRSAPSPVTSRNGDNLDLLLNQESNNINFWPFGGSRGLRWDVHLSRQVPINLMVNTGTGSSTLDLEQLKVTDLDLNSGAGSVNLTLPASAGNTTARVNGGVGSVNIDIPQGVEAHIKVSTGIGSINVDSKFAKTGDHIYESSGYKGEPHNKLDLEVDSGVGSVNVNSK